MKLKLILPPNLYEAFTKSASFNSETSTLLFAHPEALKADYKPDISDPYLQEMSIELGDKITSIIQ